jgi:hypothetical protein
MFCILCLFCLVRVFEKAGMLSCSLMHSQCIHSFMQPSSEANQIFQTHQVDFDRVLCNVLEKYDSFPGFTLLLGSLFNFTSIKNMSIFSSPPGMIAYLNLVRRRGEGYLLDAIGFSGINEAGGSMTGTLDFLTYLMELLENPERSGTRVFDQQRYTTAAKECLQLCLCSHHNFSMGVRESSHHDRELRRSKPLAWITRMRVRSRIRKAWNLQLEASSWIYIQQHASFPEKSPEHKYYLSLSYRWALDLLPFLLENSAISLKLAKVLRRCTFTMMSWQFPRRRRLAKEAISRYLLRVESAVGGPCSVVPARLGLKARLRRAQACRN